ncbi:2-oxoglutarate dehydrogenase, E2 component, dihydrolipoamide succinyltransferase [Pseudolysinimonas sp.]|uniref:2-oxoglutarate dehydrogenase, E2 component, dihydrolipoamide succinyltransferase n=1 Tax=Pseudolysinimonas sp. TaxID=2680009 RepID=UPI003F813370
MSESVSLPALGESVTEGTVTRWLKKVGDRVEVDEPLLEVSTDKVDTEIPSPVAGVIEQILVQEDETVEVGTALVTIGDGSGGGDAAPEAPAAAAPEQAAPVEQPAAPVQAAPVPEDAQPAPAPEQSAPQAAAVQAAATPTVPAPQPTPAETGVPSTEQPAEAEQAAPAPQQPVAEPAAPEQPQAAPTVDAGASYATPSPAAETAAPEAASAPPAPAAPAEPAPAPAAEAQQNAASHAGYVTPIVRKLAHEKGIDLGSVTGTGVGGRIRKQDVLDASSAPAAAEAPADSAAPREAAAVSPLRGTTVPMSRLRKVVAERAVVSMQTLAQLTTVVEVDVTKVAALRDRVKGDFLEKTGTKLSFLPFFTLAAAEALRQFPIINSTVDGDSIVYPDHENISIAVDTERGLLTPVIRDAGELNIAQLSQQIADLAARTRDNKLKPDELAGGTFTVTNTGSRGALFDTPIVFLPQSAILGTGIVAKKPVVVSEDGLDAIAIRSTVYLALSYDHRIVDGADAARFLGAVKERLEAADFAADLGI